MLYILITLLLSWNVYGQDGATGAANTVVNGTTGVASTVVNGTTGAAKKAGGAAKKVGKKLKKLTK